MAGDLSLSERWRKAAVERWYDSQDHVGQADTDPDPYVQAAADAAVFEVVRWLRHIDRLDEIKGARFGLPQCHPLWDAASLIEEQLGGPVSRRGDPVTPERIHEWHDTLANGGSVSTGPPWTYESAVKLAIVRWMNGCGPDEGDEGRRAFANVVAVLDA